MANERGMYSDLIDLFEAMEKWGAESGGDNDDDTNQRRLSIEQQYHQFFKQRLYFVGLTGLCDRLAKLNFIIARQPPTVRGHSVPEIRHIWWKNDRI